MEDMTELYHLVGVGGVGMRALAQALLDQGFAVSGSDRQGDLELPAREIALFAQDGSGVSTGCAGVIVSTAIEADNPDLLAARRLGIPVIHRATALAELVASRYELVAVAGTAGKSSVTALLGWILAESGADPCVVNGAGVVGWEDGGNRIASVRRSNGTTLPGHAKPLMVAEVDESDRSLTAFRPTHAIITNASADHFDLDETEHLFDTFRAAISGICIDTRHAPLQPQNIRPEAWGATFDWRGQNYRLPLPGAHNIANALAAIEMALRLGIPPKNIASALQTFQGIERRLQRCGTCSGALVIDDYAHNTAKLAAALDTLQTLAPRGLTALWRPHGYAPLRKMKAPLATLFAQRLRPQDLLVLLPVYDAGGTADRTVNSQDLIDLLPPGIATLVPDIPAAETLLRARAPYCDLIAILGARDPQLPYLARKLAREV